jgi:hypothetical protein
MNRADETSRPLSPDERATLRRILSEYQSPARAGLLRQIDHLIVEQGSETGWLGLAPAAGAVSVALEEGPLRVSVDVLGSDGDVVGGIRLGSNKGYVSYIDYFSLTGAPLEELPKPSQVAVLPWTSRPLSADERAVLKLILGALDDPARNGLLAQVDHLSVLAGSIATQNDLMHSDEATPVNHSRGPLDVDAYVLDSTGEPIGGILIWLTDGFLSDIEFYWYPAERPSNFPKPGHVVLNPSAEWLDGGWKDFLDQARN